MKADNSTREYRYVFSSPTTDGANKALGQWVNNAGIEKHNMGKLFYSSAGPECG